jgi:hypothetical protein
LSGISRLEAGWGLAAVCQERPIPEALGFAIRSFHFVRPFNTQMNRFLASPAALKILDSLPRSIKIIQFRGKTWN